MFKSAHLGRGSHCTDELVRYMRQFENLVGPSQTAEFRLDSGNVEMHVMRYNFVRAVTGYHKYF